MSSPRSAGPDRSPGRPHAWERSPSLEEVSANVSPSSSSARSIVRTTIPSFSPIFTGRADDALERVNGAHVEPAQPLSHLARVDVEGGHHIETALTELPITQQRRTQLADVDPLRSASSWLEISSCVPATTLSRRR